MKAIDILKSIACRDYKENDLQFIYVPEEGTEEWEQNEEWWWNEVGALPPKPIESGTYVYFNPNQVEFTMYDKYYTEVEPDVMVELTYMEYLYFYKVEEE